MTSILIGRNPLLKKCPSSQDSDSTLRVAAVASLKLAISDSAALPGNQIGSVSGGSHHSRMWCNDGFEKGPVNNTKLPSPNAILPRSSLSGPCGERKIIELLQNSEKDISCTTGLPSRPPESEKWTNSPGSSLKVSFLVPTIEKESLRICSSQDMAKVNSHEEDVLFKRQISTCCGRKLPGDFAPPPCRMMSPLRVAARPHRLRRQRRSHSPRALRGFSKPTGFA